jgi:hypothetical protein
MADIFELFEQVQDKVKFPRIVFQFRPAINATGKIKFSPIHSGQNHGSIAVSDGGPFDRNVYYGLIDKRDKQFKPRGNILPDILTIINRVIREPIRETRINGLQFNNCCYCGRELTHPNSVYYGWGPECAANYGLPWEDGGKRAEHEAMGKINKEGFGDLTEEI